MDVLADATAIRLDTADSAGDSQIILPEVALDDLADGIGDLHLTPHFVSESMLVVDGAPAGEADAQSHVFTLDYEGILHVVQRFGIHVLQIGIELVGDAPPILRICVEGGGIDDSILWKLQSSLLDEIAEIAEGLRQQTIQDMVLELYNPGELPRDLETGEPLKFTA